MDVYRRFSMTALLPGFLKKRPDSADHIRVRTYTLVPEPAAGLEDSRAFESSDAATTVNAKPKHEVEPEFEMVLGKRQAASLTFVALVVMAMCSGGSYLIGRFAAPAAASQKTQAVVPDPPPIALPVAEVLPPPEKPLFETPLKGPVYIQLGAVDKGVATLLAQGARKIGFAAFVTQGTNANVFRVLVGPFKDAAEYDSAVAKFKEIGLDNFSRRYQEN